MIKGIYEKPITEVYHFNAEKLMGNVLGEFSVQHTDGRTDDTGKIEGPKDPGGSKDWPKDPNLWGD